MTENHGVPGSNPGLATTLNPLLMGYTNLVNPRGVTFLCARVPLCAAGWLSTWLSGLGSCHAKRALLKQRYAEGP